jgi:hypothetical protein
MKCLLFYFIDRFIKKEQDEMVTVVNTFNLLKGGNEVTLKHMENPRKNSSWSDASAFFGLQIALSNGRASHGIRD